MRPILTSPRVLRTGKPLTLEGIKQACPAVFAPGPHESRGERYLYVPTVDPVQALMARGWGVYEASQQRSRAADKDPYTKHMLRMRKLEDFDTKPVVGDGIPEVILINAHDGTAAYHLKAGYFRFVCSNGLMVGQQLAGFTIRHTITSSTTAAVLEAGEKVVTEQFPIMMESIDVLKGIQLDTTQQYRLAHKARELRNGVGMVPYTENDLLAVRRPEDEEPTLWNVLNRVQESAVYGGFQVRSMGFNRQSTVRPVERVSQVTRINAGLWDEAMAIAKELS